MKIYNQKIKSAFVEYNANSRDANVGDCVKRAISFALGKDYDEVSKELNAEKRKQHASAFNQDNVWITYLKNQGYSIENYRNRTTTVEDFCEEYPEGTYILEVGKSSNIQHGWGDHLCCVMDGDIYDSWDSSKRLILKWCVIKGGKSSLVVLDENRVKDEVYEYVNAYVQNKLASKPYIEDLKFVYIPEEEKYKAPYTLHFQIFGKIPEDYFGREYRSGVSYGHNLYAKLNPRISQEENISNLKKKLKQRVYDWWYNINKELSDTYVADTIKTNPKFNGDRKDLMKVPEWARPLITGIYLDENYGYRYVAYMEPLPGDPRADMDVSFYADTLSEFKKEFEYYKENYSRYDYDY